MSIVADLYQKKVVLVGPSPSLKDSGKLIDNYDYVVRMNSALPVAEIDYEDIGYRTDILITGLADDYMSKHSKQLDYKDRIKDVYENIFLPAQDRGLKYIVTWPVKSTPFAEMQIEAFNEINEVFEVINIPLDIYLNIRDASRGEPNTGTLSIVYLLAFRLQELYVTGITYYADGYRVGYHPNITAEKSSEEGFRKDLQNNSGHRFNAQLSYLQQFRYPIFNPDAELRRVLKWD